MKTLLVCLALCASVMYADDPCYVQNPFGRAYVCGGQEPKPVPAPVVVAPPAPAAFVPTFEQGVTVQINVNGKILNTPVNEWYYATKETADAVCKRLLCFAVFEQYVFSGGPYTETAPQRILVWPDGLTENAGIMASFYTRNGENTADFLVNAQIAKDRADLQARAQLANVARARATALEASKQK